LSIILLLDCLTALQNDSQLLDCTDTNLSTPSPCDLVQSADCWQVLTCSNLYKGPCHTRTPKDSHSSHYGAVQVFLAFCGKCHWDKILPWLATSTFHDAGWIQEGSEKCTWCKLINLRQHELGNLEKSAAARLVPLLVGAFSSTQEQCAQ